MKLNRIVRTSIVLSLAAVVASSCVTNRKVAYLQDMTHETQITLEDKFEAVISPYDELDVVITSFNAELAQPFNIYAVAEVSSGTGSQANLSYLVDQNGYIELPVLGKIQAAGLTRLKLEEKIQKMLVDGGYISDPFVYVRFRAFKIFFLGANGGKAINVPNERCTFLEALALAGDLNLDIDRSKIAVVREVNGKMVMRYLDPRSSKVFSDPFFMLQQNDFIITQNVGYKNFTESFTRLQPFFTVFSTITGTASLFLTFMLYRTYYNR